MKGNEIAFSTAGGVWGTGVREVRADDSCFYFHFLYKKKKHFHVNLQTTYSNYFHVKVFSFIRGIFCLFFVVTLIAFVTTTGGGEGLVFWYLVISLEN